MTRTFLCSAILALTALSAPVMAQDYQAEDTSANVSYFDSSAQSYLSMGIGGYGIFDDDTATDLRLEYRSGNKLFWEIKPWGGIEATTDGTLWAGGGLLADFKVAPNIYLTPSLGVGLYSDGGSDIDLGHPIEFRTQLEGGYEFMNGHRVGVAFSHMSNAGLDDENPGAETLGIYYHLPIANLF